jgi:OOP family OmpA-OmpF porin
MDVTAVKITASAAEFGALPRLGVVRASRQCPCRRGPNVCITHLAFNEGFTMIRNSISTAMLGSCALAVTMMGVPFCASAADGFRQDSGFYLGAGVGYDRLNGEDFTGNGNDVDENRVTYKALGGYRLNPVISFEGQFIDFGTAENNGNRVKAHGFTAGVVVDAPVFKYVHPYAKAGALRWDADGTFGSTHRDDTGTDFTYGVGVRFAVNDWLNLRTEYERFDFNENKADNVSLALQFNF